MPRSRLIKADEGEALERPQRERYGLLIRPCSGEIMDRFRAQSAARAGFTQATYLKALVETVEDLRAVADGRVEATPAGRAIVLEILAKHGLGSVTL